MVATAYGQPQRVVQDWLKAASYVAPSGSACTTIVQYNTNLAYWGELSAASIGNSTNKYVASWFTASETASICKVSLKMDRMSALGETNSLFLSLYSDSSGLPGSQLAVVTNTYWTTEENAYQTFNLSASITSGTKYWLVLGSTRVSTWHIGTIPGFHTQAGSTNTTYRSVDLSAWYFAASNSVIAHVIFR